MAKRKNLSDSPVCRYLNRIIVESLGGPEDDPDDSHLLAAALAYISLKEIGLPVDDERDVRAALSGANIYGVDFIVAAASTMMDATVSPTTPVSTSSGST